MAKKKKNKKSKLRRSAKKRHNKQKLSQRTRDIEADCVDAPDPERRRQYLIAAYDRLEEYAINVKRDKDDSLWEPSSSEKY